MTNQHHNFQLKEGLFTIIREIKRCLLWSNIFFSSNAQTLQSWRAWGHKVRLGDCQMPSASCYLHLRVKTWRPNDTVRGKLSPWHHCFHSHLKDPKFRLMRWLHSACPKITLFLQRCLGGKCAAVQHLLTSWDRWALATVAGIVRLKGIAHIQITRFNTFFSILYQ